MPDPNNFPYNPYPTVSFPYPEIGSVIRPPGQGCLSCVHKLYCPGIYWYRTDEKKVDNYSGRACTSWSANPADIVKIVTNDDLSENQYEYETGVIYGSDWPLRFDEVGYESS